MAHSAWDSTKCLQPSSISMCFMCFLGAAVCVTAEPPGGLPGHACLLPAAARPQDSAPQSTPAVSQCPRPCSLPGKATASMPCHLHPCDLAACLCLLAGFMRIGIYCVLPHACKHPFHIVISFGFQHSVITASCCYCIFPVAILAQTCHACIICMTLSGGCQLADSRRYTCIACTIWGAAT